MLASMEKIAEQPVLFFVLLTIIIAGVSFMIMGYLQKFSTNPWFCHKMGWHITPGPQGFDGCSVTGQCPRCKKDVMRDGQGNWF